MVQIARNASAPGLELTSVAKRRLLQADLTSEDRALSAESAKRRRMGADEEGDEDGDTGHVGGRGKAIR